MGVATAYWLSRLGAAVTLLESRLLGWGATGRNAGLLLAGSSPLEDPVAMRAVLEEEGVRAGYAQCGHLALATSPEVVDGIRDEIARRSPTAPPLALLHRESCERLLGLRIHPRFAGGRWLPGAAAIDPIRLLHGLAAAAARRGAVIAERTAALRVDAGAVHTTRGIVKAERVVLACGARTGALAPLLGGMLTPGRGQVLATARLPRIFGPGLAVDRGSAYWRQAATGEIVLGGLRGRDPVAERTSREALNGRIQSALTTFLPSVFPGLGALPVRWRWAGTMDETPDGRPLVGPVPGSPGQWVIAGFGGHGLPPALGAGRALAASILGGAPADALSRLDPARFAPEPAPC
jgi:glycine/D-amino acid oxidase-like deaminating enzyme